MRKSLLWITAGVVLSGCALKGDVRRVEDQLALMREDAARADSARAVALARILDHLDGFNAEMRDSLTAQRIALNALRGEFRTDLTQVLRNMVAMQELMGQNQVGLTTLRRQLEARMQAMAQAPPPTAPGDSTAPAATPPAQRTGPEELYQIGIQQHRQNSVQTARMAFQMVLDSFPDHPRAPDAMFFLAETFEAQSPDSAAALYERVIEQYDASPRAPTALYRLGLLAERMGNEPEARLNFQRLIASYPNSDEAALAREKIRSNSPSP